MAVPFTIDFTAPNAPTNVNAAPVTLLRAPEADAVQITWTPVSTAPENLVRQELWMNDGVDWTRIAYWTDPAVASYTYPFPRSGKNILGYSPGQSRAPVSRLCQGTANAQGVDSGVAKPATNLHPESGLALPRWRDEPH
jgi:hypothetical protein